MTMYILKYDVTITYETIEQTHRGWKVLQFQRYLFEESVFMWKQ